MNVATENQAGLVLFNKRPDGAAAHMAAEHDAVVDRFIRRLMGDEYFRHAVRHLGSGGRQSGCEILFRRFIGGPTRSGQRFAHAEKSMALAHQTRFIKADIQLFQIVIHTRMVAIPGHRQNLRAPAPHRVHHLFCFVAAAEIGEITGDQGQVYWPAGTIQLFEFIGSAVQVCYADDLHLACPVLS